MDAFVQQQMPRVVGALLGDHPDTFFQGIAKREIRDRSRNLASQFKSLLVTHHKRIDLKLIQRAGWKLPQRFPLTNSGVKSGDQISIGLPVIDIRGQLDMFTTELNEVLGLRFSRQADSQDNTKRCCKDVLSQFRSFVQFNLIWVFVFSVAGCISRSESDVVVYSALDRDFAAPILAAFERTGEKETKVIAKYDVESTKTIGLVNRIIAEKDNPTCDVFWNNEIMHTVRLQKRGLLAPHDWNVDLAWPSDMVSSDGTWCGFAARARVLIVNTKLITDKEDYPSSVSDLVDAKWKGKCAMARPLFGTTATHFAVLRERNGEEATLRQLQAIKDNAVILSGNKQVALAVSAGTVAWGLTDTDDAIIEKDLGRDVAIVFPDQGSGQPGTLRIPNVIAILKNAPHPVAASKLADYLIRPETEDRLAMGNSSQLPISRQSKFPPRVMPESPVRWMRVDFERAADHWQAWATKLDQLFQ